MKSIQAWISFGIIIVTILAIGCTKLMNRQTIVALAVLALVAITSTVILNYSKERFEGKEESK